MKVRAAVKRSILKHPEKQRARELLKRAVLIGFLIKPKNCLECDEKKNIQGHHEDYEKPLEVVWLCTVCHSKRHTNKV